MPDGYAPIRVNSESVGRVRALRQQIEREDRRYVDTAKRILAPLRARLDRCPRRNFRPQMLADLERQWHTEMNSVFRVGCRSQLTKDSLLITETTIGSATLAEPAWHGDLEKGLCIAHGRLVARRGEVSIHTTLAALFSMHALARFLQRSPAGTTDDDVLDAVALLAEHNAAEIAEDEGFSIATPTGRWVGRCVVTPKGRVLAIRTWLAN